jgi:beta-glucanase (GH16 family)
VNPVNTWTNSYTGGIFGTISSSNATATNSTITIVYNSSLNSGIMTGHIEFANLTA